MAWHTGCYSYLVKRDIETEPAILLASMSEIQTLHKSRLPRRKASQGS